MTSGMIHTEPVPGPGRDEPRPAAGGEAILLFDGACAFCSASVRFVYRRDPKGRLRFAALESGTGRRLLQKFGLETSELSTMVLVVGDRCYSRSSAAIEVARRLRWPWPLLAVLALVPRPWRDCLYDSFARRRHQWFTRRQSCELPTPEFRSRFLE